jgi:hypothetical protein
MDKKGHGRYHLDIFPLTLVHCPAQCTYMLELILVCFVLSLMGFIDIPLVWVYMKSALARSMGQGFTSVSLCCMFWVLFFQ